MKRLVCRAPGSRRRRRRCAGPRTCGWSTCGACRRPRRRECRGTERGSVSSQRRSSRGRCPGRHVLGEGHHRGAHGVDVEVGELPVHRHPAQAEGIGLGAEHRPGCRGSAPVPAPCEHPLLAAGQRRAPRQRAVGVGVVDPLPEWMANSSGGRSRSASASRSEGRSGSAASACRSSAPRARA